MSSREIDLINKFWNLPGGSTIVSELILAMIHRRILAIKKFKSTHGHKLSRDQILQCNATVLNLTHLGFTFRTFLSRSPTQRAIISRLTKMVMNFRQDVRFFSRKLRPVDGFEPADEETTLTIMAKLSQGEGETYIVSYVIEMITIYVCYLEVVIVTVATIQHENRPISLNMNVLWNLVSELRSVIFTLMKMGDIKEQFANMPKISSSPLYAAIRKFHYLIETFNQNTQLTQPSTVAGQSLLRMMLEGGNDESQSPGVNEGAGTSGTK